MASRFGILLGAFLALSALSVWGPTARAAVDLDEERRARNGVVESMVTVGEQYLQDGTPQSLIEAYVWLRLADEWGGLPQSLFGRHRDALRRLRAAAGPEAAETARRAFDERREAVLEALGRSRQVEQAPGQVELTPGPDHIRPKVGRLVLTYKGGAARGCTATVIDANHVLTAAHCLEDHETGETALAAYFLPGYTGSVTEQGHAAVADRAVWDPGWRELGRVADVALVRLQASPAGRPVTDASNGALAVEPLPAPVEQTRVRLIGYPFAGSADPNRMPTERLVDRNCAVSDTGDGRLLKSADLCEMAQGASGGPVLAWNAADGRVAIVGVTSFIEPANGAAFFARITPELTTRIKGWIEDPGADPGRITIRDLMPRPIYWVAVRNDCETPVRTGVIGRPYDRNDNRTFAREVPAGATMIVAGPLSAPDAFANITQSGTGLTVFGNGPTYTIGGRSVPVSTVAEPGTDYGRIELQARCGGTG